MSNSISIKVYNKDDKLKLSIRDEKGAFDKVITMYKYDGETIYTHSYMVDRFEGKLRRIYSTIYEMRKEVNGVLKETVAVTDREIEIHEHPKEDEEITTNIIRKSGNVYQKRVKRIDDEVYYIEYFNGELSHFSFKIKEDKINEYLQKQ
jgi:hypothetical protein